MPEPRHAWASCLLPRFQKLCGERHANRPLSKFTLSTRPPGLLNLSASGPDPSAGGRPLHCGMFSSAPSLYPPPTHANPSPVMAPIKVSRHCQMPPEGPRYPWWGTTGMAPANSTESFSNESVRITGWMDFVILALSDQEVKGTEGPQGKHHC